MSTPWQITLQTGWDEIEDPAFIEQWQRIMDGAENAHVFFHPVLVRVWLETYRPLRALQPLFVLASRGQQQVVFPLVLWRRNAKNAFLRTIVPAGHSDFDYHDPIFLLPPNEDQVQSFYVALKTELDKSVKYDSMMLDGMHNEFVPAYCKVVHEEPCLQWPLGSAELTEGLVLPAKKKLAKDALRRLRKLQELGEVTWLSYGKNDIDKAQQSLAIMLRHHTNRWPNSYKADGFHSSLVQVGIEAGIINFTEVVFDDKPIAWQIGFNYKGVLSHYMPAIDPEFSNYSPGHVSLGHMLARGKDRGASIVDHLRGAEAYKSAWGGSETLIYDVIFENTALSSRIFLALFSLLRRVKALRTRLQQKQQ